VHLDGYDRLELWSGKSDKSARRELFYYDETDLMAVRVDHWKMHIGLKREVSWWNEKYYPSVPYLFNLLTDPMERMDPDRRRRAISDASYSRRSCGAPTAAGPFIAAHLKSLQEYPPSEGADTLSLKKALETAMHKLQNPHGSSN